MCLEQGFYKNTFLWQLGLLKKGGDKFCETECYWPRSHIFHREIKCRWCWPLPNITIYCKYSKVSKWKVKWDDESEAATIMKRQHENLILPSKTLKSFTYIAMHMIWKVIYYLTYPRILYFQMKVENNLKMHIVFSEEFHECSLYYI